MHQDIILERLKFHSVNIVFQEIPDEISLVFNITGCALHCDGCHSSYLWKHTGIELTNDIFVEYLEHYENRVTTILFMGGEWNHKELLKYINIALSYGYKTALYTGLSYDEIISTAPKLLNVLDFIKVGRYSVKLGGLNMSTTNQKLIDIKNNLDITYKFQTKSS